MNSHEGIFPGVSFRKGDLTVTSILKGLDKARPALFPSLCLFTICFTIGSSHYLAFNSLPDAASAAQSFFAILNDGLGATNSLETIPVFGVHLWPMGLIGLPAFFLTKSYLGLIFTQALVVSLSTVPAYRIAKHLYGSDAAKKLIWLWALNPAVIGPFSGWGEGWQPLVLALLPIMWSVYFFTSNRNAWGVAVFCVALLFREDVAIAGIAIAILLAWWQKKWKIAAIISFISFAWLTVSALILLPFLSGRDWIVWGYVSPELAVSNPSQSASIIHAFQTAIKNWIRPSSVAYLAYWLVYFGAIQKTIRIFLYPSMAIILVNLSVDTWVTRLPMLHYSALIAPFLFLALIDGFSKPMVGRKWQIFGFVLAWLLLVAWNAKLMINAGSPVNWQALNQARIVSLDCPSLALTNPRGSVRFARGQQVSWINRDHPWSDSGKAKCVLLDMARKSAGVGWLGLAEVTTLDSTMGSRGYSLRFSERGLHLWKLQSFE